VFNLLSVMELTVAVLSYHPTTTTMMSPAVCALVNVTGTLAARLWGEAEFFCTNVMVCAFSAGNSIPPANIIIASARLCRTGAAFIRSVQEDTIPPGITRQLNGVNRFAGYRVYALRHASS